ncbi:MAG: hypothetical protein RAP41_06485 [Candidatus Orphnella occulta]|nr:hypothetical protein [Candidatus Orphnella occulta]
MLSVKGVDGFMVGPYNLFASIGKPGQFDHPKVKAMIRKVESISKKMNKTTGIHIIQPDFTDANKRIRQEYNFIAFSLDTLFLGRSCIDAVSKINNRKG